MGKTAMMELIDKYKALPKSSNQFTNGLIKAFIKDATELLDREKEQIKNAYSEGYTGYDGSELSSAIETYRQLKSQQP